MKSLPVLVLVIVSLAGSVSSLEASAYSDAVLADNPFAYYRLNEPSNSLPAADEKTGNTGGYVNGPAVGIPGAISSDPGSTACSFAIGGSEYVALTTLGDLGSSMTAGFTIEYWLKDSDSTNDQAVFGVANSPGFINDFLVDIAYNAAGRLRLYYRDDHNNRYEANFYPTGGNIDIYDNAWHHIVHVYDPSASVLNDRLLFYVDGVRQAATVTLAGSVPSSSNFNHPFTLGAFNSRGSVGSFLHGSLDEFAFYKSSLSATQVLSHYRAAQGNVNANANLSSLALSDGTLTPVFSSGTTSYKASVSNTTTSITVTPTTADSGATVEINGSVVPSGTPSSEIPLNVGSNAIVTSVTSSDGTTVKLYTVTATRKGPPSVATNAASAVVFNGATLHGTLIPNGLATTAHFEYGLTNSYGSSTASQNVGAGSSVVSVQSAIGNLDANTTYHYRLVAANSNGTSNGADWTFKTLDFAVVGGWAERTVLRTLPTTVNSEVDIGALTFNDGTASIEAAVNATGTGWTVAKRYVIPIRNNLGNGSPPNTWLKVLPAHDTGPGGVNNFDLDIHVSGVTAQLRLRTLGSNGNVATARIAIKTTGLQTFFNSTATAIVAAPAQTIAGNAVDESIGKAGIGAAPSANAVLDINGGDTRGLHLRPRSVPGTPTTGTWNTGTIILDSAANLYICTAPGTPGMWAKIGN